MRVGRCYLQKLNRLLFIGFIQQDAFTKKAYMFKYVLEITPDVGTRFLMIGGE
jgi:hypothetical protein